METEPYAKSNIINQDAYVPQVFKETQLLVALKLDAEVIMIVETESDVITTLNLVNHYAKEILVHKEPDVPLKIIEKCVHATHLYKEMDSLSVLLQVSQRSLYFRPDMILHFYSLSYFS